MFWIFRTLGTAVVAGFGLKIGSEMYEKMKKKYGHQLGLEPDENKESSESERSEVSAEVD